ncbi:hypothetical protein E1A91_D12G016600v1 [Gossypium mustelinum]|uniref:Uncharacterized protein n=3 Tax=Gossypium TaxID=3633 RepID=A0A0D2R6Q0_GOSRA|nr:hypothetical protein B456_008G016200 [Gossypium raimondii]TYG39460.1 hypothetical protein ES288_D12G018000v1 [Gossypium darwinii]TYI49162.1 hypothetical protein E1A91_D12G016600v1 [Gossypium mustelinum]
MLSSESTTATTNRYAGLRATTQQHLIGQLWALLCVRLVPEVLYMHEETKHGRLHLPES